MQPSQILSHPVSFFTCLSALTLTCCTNPLEAHVIREGERTQREMQAYRQERLANEGISESQAAVYQSAYMRHFQATGDTVAAQRAAKKEAGIR